MFQPIETVLIDGAWINRYEDKSYVLSSHELKEDAKREGRAYAMAKRVEHVIKDADGKMESVWEMRNR